MFDISVVGINLQQTIGFVGNPYLFLSESLVCLEVFTPIKEIG